MEINFDKVKAFSAVTFLQLICGVIVPGFLFLFIYAKDLFLTLDLFRLSTLAISITAPVLTINGIIALFGLSTGNEESQNEDVFHRIFTSTIYIGSIITILVIYASIIIGYFFNLKLRQGIFILFIAEIIIFIVLIVPLLLESKNKRGKK
jgi:hypothetical protein